MTRKVTEIERRLINDGWYLVSKEYSGKKSEKTLRYKYFKVIKDKRNIIFLDKSRNQVIKYGIETPNIEFLDKEELKELHQDFLDLREFVEEVKLGVEPIPQELLESVE